MVVPTARLRGNPVQFQGRATAHGPQILTAFQELGTQLVALVMVGRTVQLRGHPVAASQGRATAHGHQIPTATQELDTLLVAPLTEDKTVQLSVRPARLHHRTARILRTRIATERDGLRAALSPTGLAAHRLNLLATTRTI